MRRSIPCLGAARCANLLLNRSKCVERRVSLGEPALEAAMIRWLTLAVTVAAMTCGGTLATHAEDWKATGENIYHIISVRGYELEKGARLLALRERR